MEWQNTGMMTRKRRKKQVDPSVPTEEQEQIRLATWMTNRGILNYAIPNGGKRDLLEAVKLKRCGVRSGVPDICIPHARKSYHGLYIELKRVKGGMVSFNQTYWIENLAKQGYKAVVCRGADEAMDVIVDYFEGEIKK